MSQPKRKNVYSENYEKELRHIKRSRKGAEFAYCMVCNDDINLLSTGKTAISIHQKSTKHQKAEKAANRTIPLQSFLPNTSAPSTEDRKILAAEGTWHITLRNTANLSILLTVFLQLDCSEQFSRIRSFGTIFCEKIVYDFFCQYSEQSFAVIHFLHHVLGVFNKTIDFFQKEKVILPELLTEMEKFRSKIEYRRRERFFGADLELTKVEEFARQALEEQFQAFYTCVLEYLDKWFHDDRFPEKMRWISLMSNEIPHEDALDLARQISPALTNDLFDDVSEANQILNSIPKDELQKLSPEQKWMKLFEADLPHLYKLVSIVLSIPVSNAFVERVFLLCGSQWTDKRNLLKVETVKALVQTKINFDLSCSEIYQMLMSNVKLLDQIGGWEKYFE